MNNVLPLYFDIKGAFMVKVETLRDQILNYFAENQTVFGKKDLSCIFNPFINKYEITDINDLKTIFPAIYNTMQNDFVKAELYYKLDAYKEELHLLVDLYAKNQGYTIVLPLTKEETELLWILQFSYIKQHKKQEGT